MSTGSTTQPVTTDRFGDTAAPAVKAPGGYFQDYVAQIQAALQQQVKNGVSADELGQKIFGSMLSALETNKQREDIHPSAKADGVASDGPSLKPTKVTDDDPLQATTKTRQPDGGDDDTVGVLVTEPPSALFFDDWHPIDDLSNGFRQIGEAIDQVAESIKEGGKKIIEQGGKFFDEHGREIVDGLAKVNQGMENTEGTWNSGANSHPEMGGGTHTEADHE